ncbi:MAG: hypothetical protein WCV59_01110 [Parcubacteria group bacterium]|jgi:hypothetical protein
MKRFTAGDARLVTKKNGKEVLSASDDPDESIKQRIIEVMRKKAVGDEKKAHVYFDPDGAPGSHLYFDPRDESLLDQLRYLDKKRRWIVKELVAVGYRVIVSKEMVCRICTGLPSNPCDECNGKKPVGISFERQDWISYSYIEVRW